MLHWSSDQVNALVLLRAVPFMIWGGVGMKSNLTPSYPLHTFFLTPSSLHTTFFLTKMLYGGVHARLSMKNLYGGCMQDFLCMQDKGGHTIFSRLPRGAYIFLCFKGGIQHVYSTKDPATFSLSKRCTTFCMCQRLRCLLRPTLVPDHNIVSTLTVTLLVGSISDLSFAMLFLNPQTSNIILTAFTVA